MAVKTKARSKTGGAQPRASITFPPKLYEALEQLAKEKKVSIAWVVRDATEKCEFSASVRKADESGLILA